MLIKKIFYILFTLCVMFNGLLVAGGTDEDFDAKHKPAVVNLSPDQRRKLNSFHENTATQDLARQFVAYFGIHSPYPYALTPTNYLGSILDSLTPSDLSEGSSLLFFNGGVFQRYIPQRTYEFTEGQRQMAACKMFEESLCILRGLSATSLQEISNFVQQNAAILKSGSLIELFIFWYEKLPDPTRLETLRTLFTNFQNSIGYINSPLREGGPLQGELLHVSDLTKRERILVLLTCGISDLFDLKKDFVEKVVPLLAQLSLQELAEVQDFFSEERLMTAKKNSLSLQALDSILRKRESLTVKTKGPWSGKVYLVAQHKARTTEERQQVMKALTPEQLGRCYPKQFFVLAEELDGDLPATKAVFATYLKSPESGLMKDMVSCAPIRWYPFFRLALTLPLQDFESFVKGKSSTSQTLPEITDNEKEGCSEDFEYESMIHDKHPFRHQFIAGLIGKLSWEQHLRLLAYLFFETYPNKLPRLRSPAEIQKYIEKICAQDWSNTADLEEVLSQIRTSLSQKHP